MTLPSQEYATLAAHAYEDVDVGRRPFGQDEYADIDGPQYQIIEHVNNDRTGYQGTIYQRVDGGEIVVAHRGTEQIWKDAVITDGAMVVARTNPQADDAIALTQKAIDYAAEYGMQPGRQAPEVSVTGHSLGGTLAQISAHHFDLRGETFNAYGAASLDRRIPEESNDKVTNHVMAADAVSAASPHYGAVRNYATEREIEVLSQSGYKDGWLADLVTPDLPVIAAGRSLGSHSMHNFLPVDGDRNPDVSALQDPAAMQRAEDHSRMIEDYRGDVEGLRRAVTIGARGPVGWVEDSIDYFRGPVEAGTPAREAAEKAAQEAAPVATAYAVSDDRPLQFDLEPTSSSAAVNRLLEAARTGDEGALRAATDGLQKSDAGQAWQQQADHAAQVPDTHHHVQEQAGREQAAARM